MLQTIRDHLNDPHRPHSAHAAATMAVILALAAAWQILEPVSLIFRVVALVLAVSFAVRYVNLPWRETAEGKHIMAFTIITALFMAYACTNTIWAYVETGQIATIATWPGRQVVGLVLYMVVSWELWQRNRLLTVANREALIRRLQP